MSVHLLLALIVTLMPHPKAWRYQFRTVRGTVICDTAKGVKPPNPTTILPPFFTYDGSGDYSVVYSSASIIDPEEVTVCAEDVHFAKKKADPKAEPAR